MRLIVLSDIHDHIDNLRRALEGARGEAVICCGDLCSPFMIDELASGFPGPIHLVFGNNDGDQFRITRAAGSVDRIHLHGEFAELDDGEIPDRRVGVHHFPAVGRSLAGSDDFDLVCFGHSHVYEEGRDGQTLWVNPGEIMGRKGPVTWAEYDSVDHRIERREL